MSEEWEKKYNLICQQKDELINALQSEKENSIQSLMTELAEGRNEIQSLNTNIAKL